MKSITLIVLTILFLPLKKDNTHEFFQENFLVEDEYLIGDWNGDRKDNIAVRRKREIIMDYNFDSRREFTFYFGNGNDEDEYLVGDWNGDGIDNIAVRRGREIIIDHNFDSEREFTFYFGGRE